MIEEQIDQYREWIHTEILEYLCVSDDGYNQKIILNITFKFPNVTDENDFGTQTAFIEDRWSKLDIFYNKICCHMIGRKHLFEDDSIKPQMWAFLESGGSKYAKCTGNLFDTHLHTVWIIDKSKEEVLDVVRNKALNMKVSHFSDIYVQPVEFAENWTENIENVASYNAKFQRFEARRPEIVNSLQKYPRSKKA
jgi:hypothetical protein